MAVNEVMVLKRNSSNIYSENKVTAVANRYLGFDSSLNPIMGLPSLWTAVSYTYYAGLNEINTTLTTTDATFAQLLFCGASSPYTCTITLPAGSTSLIGKTYRLYGVGTLPATIKAPDGSIFAILSPSQYIEIAWADAAWRVTNSTIPQLAMTVNSVTFNTTGSHSVDIFNYGCNMVTLTVAGIHTFSPADLKLPPVGYLRKISMWNNSTGIANLYLSLSGRKPPFPVAVSAGKAVEFNIIRMNINSVCSVTVSAEQDATA